MNGNNNEKEINYADSLRKLSEGPITFEESEIENEQSKLSVINNISRESQKRSNKNEEPKVWDNLYPILYDEQVIIHAYSLIRNNKGSTTPGVSGESIDGFSMYQVRKIAECLKNHTYKPQPVLQVLIPKPGKSEKRPLGIPEFTDRIVAEMIRQILEAIYEPEFEKVQSNHGFRPKKSTHTALNKIAYQLQGLDYTIEGDIKGAYPSLDHIILLNLLKKRIKCKALLRLIWHFLKAGIFDTELQQYSGSLSGVPQGQLFSPILFNVYMHEFDLFVHGELQEFINKTYNINRNESPQLAGPYRRATSKIRQKKDTIQRVKNRNKDKPFAEWSIDEKQQMLELQKLIQSLEDMRSKLPTRNKAEEMIRYHFVRYADDWILSTNADLKITGEIREKIRSWLLDNLKFVLHPEKTKICDIHSEQIKFLGFSMGYYTKRRRRIVETVKDSVAKRVGTGLFINPDWERIQARLEANGYCSINKTTGRITPKEKPGYALLNLDQIYNKYNSILRGLFNYYEPIISTPSQLYRIQYILTYSFIKTCSHKYKLSVAQLCAKNYHKELLEKDKPPVKIYKELAMVSGKEITLELVTLRTFKKAKESREVIDDVFKIYKLNWRTKKSLLYGRCSLCGSTEKLESHHLRSIRSLETKFKKKHNTEKSQALKYMQAINRKTIPLCHEHHVEVTNGTLSPFASLSLREIYEYRISQQINRSE